MKYMVEFTVDTGYELKEYLCIVNAESESGVKNALKTWAVEHLKRERVLMDEYTFITPLGSEPGIVWTNYPNS